MTKKSCIEALMIDVNIDVYFDALTKVIQPWKIRKKICHTVKPLYSGHHLDWLKVSTIERCPPYRGECIFLKVSFALSIEGVERTIRKQLYQLFAHYRL